MADENLVLFICTGNYYRSRFAEAVFNHIAERRKLPWRAFSRGLMAHLAPGPISEHTQLGLLARGIRMRHTAPGSVQLSEKDLQAASIVIALKDEEHRPMMIDQYPQWADKLFYWDVTDIPAVLPQEALPAIEEEVRKLIDFLVSHEDDPKEAAGSTPRAEREES